MSRIGVIGAGISGMSAAYLLSKKHEVWLFEREPRLGGHTHTHSIETSGGVRAIDTGFIVHNDRTYPNLVRLFAELGVERQKSNMSFGVSGDDMEYSSRGLAGFFATPTNLFRPAHYRFLMELMRFNRVSTKLVEQNAMPEITLAEYLTQHAFSPEFSRLYLCPMAAAVWSTSLDKIQGFPAMTLLRFFYNHGFLTINGRPQWYVVKGGSSAYIAPLTAPYQDRIVTDAAIRCVSGTQDGAAICFHDGSEQRFDEVVFACHGLQALNLIADATQMEREVLGCFKTTENVAALHTDETVLPKSSAARASWNYHLDRRTSSPALTYSMNRLQSLNTPEEYCVTLNDAGTIDRTKLLREITYFHPLYTLEAIRAQARWGELNGARHLHFCGAYWFYGFHEDGLNSAIRVAKSLGVEWDA